MPKESIPAIRRIASLGRMKRDASLTGCKAEILSVFLPSDTSLRDAD